MSVNISNYQFAGRSKSTTRTHLKHFPLLLKMFLHLCGILQASLIFLKGYNMCFRYIVVQVKTESVWGEQFSFNKSI